jgi:hypothetical protein
MTRRSATACRWRRDFTSKASRGLDECRQPSCHGWRTVNRRLAHQSVCGPARRAHTRTRGPTFCAHEPTRVCKRLANRPGGQHGVRMGSAPYHPSAARLCMLATGGLQVKGALAPVMSLRRATLRAERLSPIAYPTPLCLDVRCVRALCARRVRPAGCVQALCHPSLAHTP